MIFLILSLMMQLPEVTLVLTEDSLGLCTVGSCGYTTGFPEPDTLEIAFVEESGTVYFMGIISNDMDMIMLDDSTKLFTARGILGLTWQVVSK